MEEIAEASMVGNGIDPPSPKNYWIREVVALVDFYSVCE